MYSIKFTDPSIYGIDWNIDDDGYRKRAKPKNKPWCTYQGVQVGEGATKAFLTCPERVSTEHERPKPFCADHVLENPYVQDMLERYASIVPAEERKRVKAWEEEYIDTWKTEVMEQYNLFLRGNTMSDMNLENLKDEIIAELGQLSDMTISECRSEVNYPTCNYKDGETDWIWDLHEDPNKNLSEDSDWIAKEATNQKVGEVVLRGTKLYFKSVISRENMYLADLIEPDSFDKAIVALKAALNVANVFKTPTGFKMPPKYGIQ